MRFYKIVAMLLMVNNLSPVIAYSDNTHKNINYNGFNFEFRDDSDNTELILTKYTGNDENLSIPENVNGYNVTAIDSEAFADNYTIKNVTIPATIDYFGSGFFSISCNGFNFRFRDYFDENSDLILTAYTGNDENLSIPENVNGHNVTAIDSEAFANNYTIKNVTLPDTIDYFGSGVFLDSSLVSVNIPESLNVIPEYSFSNCPELETVVFHDEICVLDCTAFEQTGIEIPSYLNDRIRDSVSSSYISFTSTYGEHDDWIYEFSNFELGTGVRIEKCNSTDAEIVVPDKINGAPVETINQFAFDDCKSTLKSIYFPENILYFECKFRDFILLEEITLPNIDTICSSQFRNCRNLKKVKINSNSKHFRILNNAFENCNIDYVPCPENCTSISIGNNTFRNCVNITSLPDTTNCTSIDIGDSAFANTSVSEVRLNCDSKIASNAFLDCQNLSYVELNNSKIRSKAFHDCPELDTVIINGNSTLEECSFYDCRLLKNITLSDFDIQMTNAVYNCPEFMTINNQNAFDNTTGDFNKELKDFIFNNFSGVDDVGFINLYVQAQAQKIIDEITSDNMSDVQKIRAVHDWICKNTVYDDEQSFDRKNHNDASVFMNDSTVCEGYARIANILYNTAGIESYYIEGIDHAWNIVRAGNNYFHVDTTWDDGEEISYDWFMKSDEELRTSGGNHASWINYIPSSLHSFQEGKDLPECTYSMGDVNQDNNVNIADMVVMNKSVLGNDSIGYDSYILADLTFDGVVDSFDLVKMRQLIILMTV